MHYALVLMYKIVTINFMIFMYIFIKKNVIYWKSAEYIPLFYMNDVFNCNFAGNPKSVIYSKSNKFTRKYWNNVYYCWLAKVGITYSK